MQDVRLGVDIGGTFTDVALEVGDQRYTAKGLTTPRAPEEGVLAILGAVIAEGPPAEVLASSAVIASYLGTDESTVQRSGPQVVGA